MPFRRCSVFILMLCAQAAFSQDKDSAKEGPLLKLDLNFVNNSVYLGRKDSATLSYLTPGLFFTSPSGFFASASLSFLTQEHRVDATTLEAGYDYSRGGFDANLSAAKYFYNTQSENVRSALSASLNGSFSFETPYVTPVLSGSISMGNNRPDYFAGFSLEHSFYAADDALTITPSVTANGSTQHFYDGYFQVRKGGKKKQLSGTFTVSQEVTDASSFKILDYELSSDFSYKLNRLSFYATPVYAIATNPNTIVTTVRRPNGVVLTTQSKTETLSNSFYCTVGVSWKWRL